MAALGIHFGQPVTAPVVSEAQALTTARLRAGADADQATAALGRYVLFSDDQYYSVDAAGQERYAFHDVPAWVITFRGTYYGRGPTGGTPNTELNVAINALTGECMDAFSFR